MRALISALSAHVRRTSGALGRGAARVWWGLVTTFDDGIGVTLATVHAGWIALRAACAAMHHALVRRRRPAWRDVPVHVLLVARNERTYLERELRQALRDLERANGPALPGARLSVIAHHSLDTTPPVASRCVPMRPGAGGEPAVLIELGLNVDGCRLTPGEVVSQLASRYVALAAGTGGEGDGGAGDTSVVAGEAPAAPCVRQPSESGEAPAEPHAGDGHGTPGDAADPLGLLSLLGSAPAGSVPLTGDTGTPPDVTPSSTGTSRDAHGRWRRRQVGQS